MRKQWKLVEVLNRLYVPFDWKDSIPGGQNLGRAEFQVCIKFLRKKVSEFWVYPVQSRLETYWHYLGGDVDFSIQSYEGLNQPNVWLASYCTEHKTTMLHIYSPNNAKFLGMDYHGISFWKYDPYKKG
jgi:hypothetical protein